MPTEVDFIPKQFVITSETEPAGFEGLIWYNPTTRLWKLYTNNEWKILIPFYVGDSAPTEAVDGMLWYDTLNDVTKVYDKATATWNRLGVDWADITNKPIGQANGICELDANALVPLNRVPIIGEVDVYAFYDDFGDGLLTGRVKELTVLNNKVMLARVLRLEWAVDGGIWDASNLFLRESSNTRPNYLYTSLDFTVGTWEVDFRFPNGESTADNQLGLVPLWIDSDNWYFWFCKSNAADPDFNFYKVFGGVGTMLINQTWTIDAAWHTAKVTRDANGNFEIFLDGVSKGTVVDTDITTSNQLRFRTAYVNESPFDFDNLRVY